MEAVGVAANLIAVITLALQATKIAYTTVSSIRNAPNNIQRVSEKIVHIQEILEILRSQANALKSQGNIPNSSLALYTDLSDSVQQCGKDMSEISDSLKPFVYDQHENVTKRLIKRLKTSIKEARIEEIVNRIDTCLALLQTRINISDR